MKRSILIAAALLLLSTAAYADRSLAGSSARPANDIVVTPAGTVLVVQPVAAGARLGQELVAVANAQSLWTYAPGLAIHDVVLVGDLVAVTTGPGPDAEKCVTNMHALRLTNGTEAWSLEIEGNVQDLETAGGILYANVATCAASSSGPFAARRSGPRGGTGADHTIVAIQNGAILWSYPLE